MTTLDIKEALTYSNRLTISDSPQLDCQVLLCHAIHRSRTWLIAHDDYALSDSEADCFRKSIIERSGGKPIAYITGTQEFWSLDFVVNETTLIPRPDTELLVETVLNRCKKNTATVIDLGTGCGAIAVSIAFERPEYTVFATDRIHATLQTARQNSQRLADNPVSFVQANWLQSFAPDQFDIIVTNPPYIEPDDNHLPALIHEPNHALVAQDSGLKDIRQIVSSASGYLKSGGMILIEHGFNQQNEVGELLATYHFKDIEPLMDLNGQPRAMLAYKHD